MDKLDSAVTEKSQSLEKRLHELATKSQEDPNTRRQLEQLIKLMESVVHTFLHTLFLISVGTIDQTHGECCTQRQRSALS